MEYRPSGCLRCLIGTREWKGEGEDRAFRFAAFDPDVATMHLDDLARDVEAYSRTGNAGRRSGTEELVEDLAEFVRGNSDSPIAHGTVHRFTLADDAHLDGGGAAGILHCVRQEIAHDLLDQHAVASDLNWLRGRRHAHQRPALDLIVADMLAHRPDHIAVTGDLVNLGLPAEYEAAREWLSDLGSPDNVTVILIRNR